MSHHHKHKHKHHKNREPQVKSDSEEQRKKAAEHEPQAAKPTNSGMSVSPLAPGIPATEPNPPKEAKDDEKQELSEGGAQGEVPDDNDQKIFKAVKALAPALADFVKALPSPAHLDADTKALLDAATKIVGRMDSQHVDSPTGAAPEVPDVSAGNLDKQAEDEGKAGTADQPLTEKQDKDINNTPANDGKVNEDGKILKDGDEDASPLAPAPSTAVKDLPDAEKPENQPVPEPASQPLPEGQPSPLAPEAPVPQAAPSEQSADPAKSADPMAPAEPAAPAPADGV
jgi:hypothetical protein